MRKSRILSMSAAVAAMTLSLTPGVAVARPADKRGSTSIVSFPLLALQASEQAMSPSGHFSHSSHVSHSSHYSSSHNSHASHASHFSSVPPSPSPSPTPSVTSTPTPTPTPATHHHHHHRRTATGKRHHHPAVPKSKS